MFGQGLEGLGSGPRPETFRELRFFFARVLGDGLEMVLQSLGKVLVGNLRKHGFRKTVLEWSL